MCRASALSPLRLLAKAYSIKTLTISCSGITITGAGPGDGEGHGTTIKLLPGDGDGIRFAPPDGDARLKGARISGVRIDGRDRTGGSAIAFDMVEHGSVDDVVLRDVHDGIRFGSGIHYTASSIFMDQVRHNGFIVRGRYPESCAREANIANCPQRQDVVAIQDVFMGSALGHETEMTGIHWYDFSATLNVRNVQVVNPNHGIFVECGTGSMDACPHFFNGWNFEVDFARTAAVRASDFQEWKCFDCYFNGFDAKTGPLLTFFDKNLSGSSGVQLVGGKALGSGSSLIEIAVANARVSDMDLYNASLAEPGHSSAVRLWRSEQGSATLATIRGNTFCSFGGATPSDMGGVVAETGTSRILVTDNLFYGCTSGWSNAGGSNEVLAANNLGP